MKVLLSLFMMSLLVAAMASSALSDDPEPTFVPVPESIRERVSTSAVGLVEEFAISGRMVHLNNRFQTISMVTKDDKGRLKVKSQKLKSDKKHHPVHRH